MLTCLITRTKTFHRLPFKGFLFRNKLRLQKSSKQYRECPGNLHSTSSSSGILDNHGALTKIEVHFQIALCLFYFIFMIFFHYPLVPLCLPPPEKPHGFYFFSWKGRDLSCGHKGAKSLLETGSYFLFILFI